MAHPSVGSALHPNHSQAGGEAAPSPSLHRALESLMVNLDDELLRYRQSRTGSGGRPLSPRKLTFRPKTQRSTPSLIHLQPTHPQGSVNGGAPTQAAPDYFRADRPSPAPSPTPGMMAGARPDSPQGQPLTPYPAMPDAYLESTAALLDSTPAALEWIDGAPHEYLGNHPQAEADDQPSLVERLATPLGVGALLLLLVGSAGLGYLMTSPPALDQWGRQAWVQRLQGTPAPDTEATTAAPDAETETSDLTGLQGIGPDLSDQEFNALDLDRVSQLPGEPTERDLPTQTTATTNRPETPNGEGADRPAPGASTTPRETPSNRSTSPEAPQNGQLAATASPRSTPPTTVAPSAVVPGSARPTAPPVPRQRHLPPPVRWHLQPPMLSLPGP